MAADSRRYGRYAVLRFITSKWGIMAADSRRYNVLRFRIVAADSRRYGHYAIYGLA